jgi:hypothetical protein
MLLTFTGCGWLGFVVFVHAPHGFGAKGRVLIAKRVFHAALRFVLLSCFW